MKKTTIAGLLFLFIMCLLGLPWIYWWFNGDDFHGLFLAWKSKSWKDLLYYFYDGHTNQDIGPTNCLRTNGRSGFFSTYYRPLYLVFLTLQYWVLGLWAQGYLLCNVFFHALNTTLLFTIFSWLAPIVPAVLVSLLFAFHPQIAYRFGAIVNLQYYMNVTLMLGMLLAYKKYLDTKHLKWNLLVCGLFLISIFTRETLIVFPLILLIGGHLYQKQSWLTHIKNTLGLWLISISFVALRLWLYPLQQLKAQPVFSWLSCKPALATKFQELLMFIYDSLGISWVSYGHKYTRLFFVMVLLFIFISLFRFNRYKPWILLCLLAGKILLWPAYIGCYSPRYFYEIHPFILMAFVLCFVGYNRAHGERVEPLPFKKFGLFLLSTIVGLSITFTLHCFYARQTKMHELSTATYQLANNPAIKNRALCFVSYPMDGFGAHPADIFWILLNDRSIPILCDNISSLVQVDSNLVIKWGIVNLVAPYFDQDYVTVTQVDGGLRFVSNTPAKVSFSLSHAGCSLGCKVTNARLEGFVTDITLHLDKQWLDYNPLYIEWSYAKKDFVILNS